MKKKKILEISLQHREEVEKAIEFNAENNYEYILIDTNNCIEFDNLTKLLRNGYEMNIYANNVELKHKKYNKEIENIRGSE